MKKRTGLLKDPWRTGLPQEKPKLKKKAEESARPVPSPPKREDDEEFNVYYATLEVKNYGGITLEKGRSPTEVAVRLLKFCVEHLEKVEEILLQYGIIITKTVRKERDLLFYLQRPDGWLLAIPDVSSREVACFQLVQAVLAIQEEPKLKALLQEYKLRAYKQ